MRGRAAGDESLQGLLYVHRLVPNVQTFDIIVDCCRHSMEEPGVYEELRKLKLPSIIVTKPPGKRWQSDPLPSAIRDYA